MENDDLEELREEWAALESNTLESFNRLPRGALVATIRHLSRELLNRTEIPPGEKHDPPWPVGHLWTEWMPNTGLPNASYYRGCVHPFCLAIETKPAPTT